MVYDAIGFVCKTVSLHHHQERLVQAEIVQAHTIENKGELCEHNWSTVPDNLCVIYINR